MIELESTILLQLRGMGKEQSPFIEELKKAEEDAQIRGVGLWNKVCVCVLEGWAGMCV